MKIKNLFLYLLPLFFLYSFFIQTMEEGETTTAEKISPDYRIISYKIQPTDNFPYSQLALVFYRKELTRSVIETIISALHATNSRIFRITHLWKMQPDEGSNLVNLENIKDLISNTAIQNTVPQKDSSQQYSWETLTLHIQTSQLNYSQIISRGFSVNKKNQTSRSNSIAIALIETPEEFLLSDKLIVETEDFSKIFDATNQTLSTALKGKEKEEEEEEGKEGSSTQSERLQPITLFDNITNAVATFATGNRLEDPLVTIALDYSNDSSVFTDIKNALQKKNDVGYILTNVDYIDLYTKKIPDNININLQNFIVQNYTLQKSMGTLINKGSYTFNLHIEKKHYVVLINISNQTIPFKNFKILDATKIIKRAPEAIDTSKMWWPRKKWLSLRGYKPITTNSSLWIKNKNINFKQYFSQVTREWQSYLKWIALASVGAAGLAYTAYHGPKKTYQDIKQSPATIKALIERARAYWSGKK